MTNNFKVRPFLLENQIQHYAWGTRGEEAFIPRLLGFEAEPGEPYAELWMGAHPKAPSMAVVGDERVPLPDLVAQHPEAMLGPAVAEAFGGKLPFLFKVLSAAEALSIQTHPNAEQAQALHARDPEHYRDPHHKPEVAVALDGLTALVGFRPPEALRDVLALYPEIASFVGPDVVACLDVDRAPCEDQVRAFFSTLIRRALADEAGLAQAIERLAARLRASNAALTEREALFLILQEQYTDAGLFALFLLNLVHLEPGQGIFTEAGVPHAYLKGNIIECMANSDNVVRVGLTPKFKDAMTLLEIVSYDAGLAEVLGSCVDADEIVYATPAREFEVRRWRITPGEPRRVEPDSVTIWLVTEGAVSLRWDTGSLAAQQGQSVLVPAGVDWVEVEGQDEAVVFVAGVP